MPLLIFSKIEVFQLSSFITWSYSTTAAVNSSGSLFSKASIRMFRNLHSRVDVNVKSREL